jgi:hypothetical protein
MGAGQTYQWTVSYPESTWRQTDMARTELPDPGVRPPGAPALDVGALERDLADGVDGEVRFDAGSRGAYSTDASNYRQVPIGVAAGAVTAAWLQVGRSSTTGRSR